MQAVFSGRDINLATNSFSMYMGFKLTLRTQDMPSYYYDGAPLFKYTSTNGQQLRVEFNYPDQDIKVVVITADGRKDEYSLMNLDEGNDFTMRGVLEVKTVAGGIFVSYLQNNYSFSGVTVPFNKNTTLTQLVLGQPEPDRPTGSLLYEVFDLRVFNRAISSAERDEILSPTGAPTSAPTRAPISAPTSAPTRAPISAPTSAPTRAPTAAPTYSPCNEELSKMCINNISGGAFESMGKRRLCPANCPGSDCIDWGDGYLEFKNVLKTSTNSVMGDIINVIPESKLKNYVSLYNLASVANGTNEGESGEVNCWLNCMSTSKCVGYKWDTSDAQCTMYSSMRAEISPKNGTEVIKWMCGENVTAGTICSFDTLIRGKGTYASGSRGNYEFQPDPSCPVYNCDGAAVSTLAM